MKDLEIFFQNQRGDHRRHLHLQRGDHSKISKKKKVLQTLPNFKGIINNYFFDEKKYFEGLRRRFERFRNFLPKPKGGPQASLALAKGGPQ